MGCNNKQFFCYSAIVVCWVSFSGNKIQCFGLVMHGIRGLSDCLSSLNRSYFTRISLICLRNGPAPTETLLYRHVQLSIISVTVEMYSVTAYNLAKRWNIKKEKQRPKNRAHSSSLSLIIFSQKIVFGKNLLKSVLTHFHVLVKQTATYVFAPVLPHPVSGWRLIYVKSQYLYIVLLVFLL